MLLELFPVKDFPLSYGFVSYAFLLYLVSYSGPREATFRVEFSPFPILSLI